MGNGWSEPAHGGGISKKEIDRMQRRFQRLARGTNHVVIDDFEQLMGSHSNPFTRRIFEVFDTNHDGFLELEEFTAAVEELSSMTTLAERSKFLFRLYDVDRDGYISKADLFTVLKSLKGLTLSDVHLKNLVSATISQFDEDQDGCLSLSEFWTMLAQTEEQSL